MLITALGHIVVVLGHSRSRRSIRTLHNTNHAGNELLIVGSAGVNNVQIFRASVVTRSLSRTTSGHKTVQKKVISNEYKQQLTAMVAGSMFSVTQPEASGWISGNTGRGCPFVMFKMG